MNTKKKSSGIKQNALSFLKKRMTRLNNKSAPFTPTQRLLLEGFYMDRINYIKTL